MKKTIIMALVLVLLLLSSCATPPGVSSGEDARVEAKFEAAQNELQQQLRTIQQQDTTIRELQEERENFIAFVNELNTEMNALLIKIWPTGEELKDIAVTVISPTGERREYSYLECDDLQIKLEKLGAGIEEQNDWLKEAVEELILKQSQLEAATFELGEDMLVKPTEARWFDCDDNALYMFYYFTNVGYEVDIVKGNLDLTGEWQLGCDHIWVVVYSDGIVYPYDWGEYCPDSQHHEYYKMGFIELLLAAGID